MQTAEYTITRHDAKMIRELISFLGEDVFDQRQRDGAFGKSEPFLRRIRDVRGVLKQIGADEQA